MGGSDYSNRRAEIPVSIPNVDLIILGARFWRQTSDANIVISLFLLRLEFRLS